MKYAIVNIVWAKSHGIEVLPEMRTSTDQSKVILHEEFLSPFGDEEFPTIDDPIPYNEGHDPLFAGMILESGKYYKQDNVTYKCTRDSGIALVQDLSALVGHYVEVAR